MARFLRYILSASVLQLLWIHRTTKISSLLNSLFTSFAPSDSVLVKNFIYSKFSKHPPQPTWETRAQHRCKKKAHKSRDFVETWLRTASLHFLSTHSHLPYPWAVHSSHQNHQISRLPRSSNAPNFKTPPNILLFASPPRMASRLGFTVTKSRFITAQLRKPLFSVSSSPFSAHGVQFDRKKLSFSRRLLGISPKATSDQPGLLFLLLNQTMIKYD